MQPSFPSEQLVFSPLICCANTAACADYLHLKKLSLGGSKSSTQGLGATDSSGAKLVKGFDVIFLTPPQAAALLTPLLSLRPDWTSA